MHVELYCNRCSCRFTAAEDADSLGLERAIHDVPWCALGDGNTLEDSIHGALGDDIACPACGLALAVTEAQLGELAMEMLAAF